MIPPKCSDLPLPPPAINDDWFLTSYNTGLHSSTKKKTQQQQQQQQQQQKEKKSTMKRKMIHVVDQDKRTYFQI